MNGQLRSIWMTAVMAYFPALSGGAEGNYKKKSFNKRCLLKSTKQRSWKVSSHSVTKDTTKYNPHILQNLKAH
jgi:hypothetical protein